MDVTEEIIFHTVTLAEPADGFNGLTTRLYVRLGEVDFSSNENHHPTHQMV